ncbi:MAG TPA: MBL fold metallo-hydrolase [Baekduia sp.]|nr:MBL fold metallo-hydrolase [Baekduia sp.]
MTLPSDAGRRDGLTWIGHSTVTLDLGGTRLITDPVLRPWLLHLRRHGPLPAPAAIRGVDGVLVSHLHLDHLDVPSLRMLGAQTPIVAPRGAGAFLRRRGFRAVLEVAAGDALRVGGAEVTAVPAVHDGHRRPGGPVAAPLGYVVRAGGLAVYFAGDTALFPEMAGIGAPGLDVALLPVWGWGTKLGPGHLDPPQAARAAALLHPAVAVPIHWGTFFPRGLAGRRGALLVVPPRRFAAEVARVAPDVAVRVLAPGGHLALAPLAAAGRLR